MSIARMDFLYRPEDEQEVEPADTGDFRAQLDAAREADFNSPLELGTRYFMIALAGVALFFVTGKPIFVAWVLAYCLSHVAYGAYVLRPRPVVSQRSYLGAVLLKALSGFVYAVCPVYLWLTAEAPELKALALCGIIGHAMYNLARHRTATLTTACEALLVVAPVVILGVYEFVQADSLPARVLVCVGAATFGAYYVVAQYNIIREREALMSSRGKAIETQKMHAMTQVTAGIAQDFNNILTVIHGNIDLAESSSSPAERQELLNEARRSVERGSTLVSQMLSYVGKAPLRVRPVPLRYYTTRLQPLLAPLLPSSVEFNAELDDPSLVVRADQASLDTALIHLVANARDAMGSAGGRLSLHIARSDARQWPQLNLQHGLRLVSFSLRDTGPGASENALHALHEPFFTTKPVGAGSGLGLSMVKGFAEQLGGGLALRNHPDGGFEATLLLPEHIK